VLHGRGVPIITPDGDPCKGANSTRAARSPDLPGKSELPARNMSRLRQFVELSNWLIFSSRLLTNAWISTGAVWRAGDDSDTRWPFAMTANSQIHC